MARNVLVTGAASGIGRRLTTALADRNYRVVATDVDVSGLEESAERNDWDPSRVRYRRLDVTDADDWRETVAAIEEDLGPLDLLIHAAGYVHPGYVFEVDIEELDRQVDINLKGTMYGTRIVGEAMATRGAGHIVNFGSLASLAAVPGLGVYSGTKFGVRGFSLAAAQELRGHGVDVSVVLPDAVDTPMLEKQTDYDEAVLSFSGTQPLTVDRIEEVVLEEVLPNRPLEVTIPRGRGGLAKLSGFFPAVSRLLAPVLEKIGRRNQQRYRDD